MIEYGVKFALNCIKMLDIEILQMLPTERQGRTRLQGFLMNLSFSFNRETGTLSLVLSITTITKTRQFFIFRKLARV